MIVDKGRFLVGLGLMILFLVVLVVIFSPVVNGETGLDFLDNTYNSISKGSAYYIPLVRDRCADAAGTRVAVTLQAESEEKARQLAPLLENAGSVEMVEQGKLRFEGSIGSLLESSVDDSDLMYANDVESVTAKYGYDGRRVLFNWWFALHEIERDLKRQRLFEEAELTAFVTKKAVEPAYNYLGIEAQHISEKIWIVVLSLVFYVIYTVWYGFAFMFMFEGLGLKLGH
jgi:hypothetical protein